MDFMALFFTMETRGHYVTMLLADWSMSTSHDLFALQVYGKKWYGTIYTVYTAN